jgi:site-specific DNA-cytosine methylase
VVHIVPTSAGAINIKHIPTFRRHLTADECLALQGFDPAKVRRPQVTALQMRQLCGNAMHCGVLAEVLALLLDETE